MVKPPLHHPYKRLLRALPRNTLKNLLKTLPRSVLLHGPLGAHPTPPSETLHTLKSSSKIYVQFLTLFSCNPPRVKKLHYMEKCWGFMFAVIMQNLCNGPRPITQKNSQRIIYVIVSVRNWIKAFSPPEFPGNSGTTSKETLNLGTFAHFGGDCAPFCGVFAFSWDFRGQEAVVQFAKFRRGCLSWSS